MKAEVRMISQEPRDANNLSKLEKARNGFPPRVSRRDTAKPTP